MHFYFRRSYRGPLALAIFDWAGTTVDFGCMAPAAVFVEGFRRQGVDITMTEARAPMGMEKRAHIAAIGAMPVVAERWQQAHGRTMNDEDIDAMYEAFVPLLLNVLDDHAVLIPGLLETAAALRKRSIRIAGTTGYFEAAMDVVLAAAARQGYAPDFSICATQVPAGRPAPWMIYRAMETLSVYPSEAVVKIGDTVPDIEAGLNAGVWTVGVTQSGNAVGLSQADFAALSPDEQGARTAAARQMLEHAGAHFVIDGVWDLPSLIDQINAKLQTGERP
jgi:phosphonoacetaldehyde hydrolase